MSSSSPDSELAKAGSNALLEATAKVYSADKIASFSRSQGKEPVTFAKKMADLSGHFDPDSFVDLCKNTYITPGQAALVEAATDPAFQMSEKELKNHNLSQLPSTDQAAIAQILRTNPLYSTNYSAQLQDVAKKYGVGVDDMVRWYGSSELHKTAAQYEGGVSALTADTQDDMKHEYGPHMSRMDRDQKKRDAALKIQQDDIRREMAQLSGAGQGEKTPPAQQAESPVMKMMREREENAYKGLAKGQGVDWDAIDDVTKAKLKSMDPGKMLGELSRMAREKTEATSQVSAYQEQMRKDAQALADFDAQSEARLQKLADAQAQEKRGSEAQLLAMRDRFARMQVEADVSLEAVKLGGNAYVEMARKQIHNQPLSDRENIIFQREKDIVSAFGLKDTDAMTVANLAEIVRSIKTKFADALKDTSDQAITDMVITSDMAKESLSAEMKKANPTESDFSISTRIRRNPEGVESRRQELIREANRK
ncbi:MAG: hypothetical protein WCO78_04875 [Candidatus Roizmanbacteria bacterium]